ncbi:hypothetical protein EV363DRAFT_1411022 [Boletus edulis]|nr:hypothetical protein EV363DRAFT_1411022 [Boletus edulis]
MSKSSVPPGDAAGGPPRRTARVSNCQHPGLLLKSQATRRTPAQKLADDKKAADARTAKADATRQGVERIADIENMMEASQVAASVPVKPVRPRPKVIKKAAVNDGAKEVDNSEVVITGTKPKKALSKSSLRDAIEGARKERLSATASKDGSTRATLFFMNAAWSIWDPSSTSKAAMVGQVKDWLTVMNRANSPRPQPGPNKSRDSSHSSLSIPPPSTTVSSKSSISTRATTLVNSFDDPLITLDFPHPDACAGGFGCADGVHDEDEKTAFVLAGLANKSRPMTNLVEVTPTEEAPPPPSQWCLKKRKCNDEYVPSSVFEEQQEEEDENMDAEIVYEEESQLPPWAEDAGELPEIPAEMVGVSRKTDASSVTITKHTSKKIKLESSEPQVGAPSPLTEPTVTSQVSSIAGDGSNSTGGNGNGPQRFNNTSLPSSFSKDGKWRKVVITTLCLWAAGQADVWNISKAQIAEVLKEIMSIVYPEIADVGSHVSASSAPVAAYQRLCEWRHGVGSAAIALFTSFFAGKADDEIEQTAQQLLDKLAFLYEDFDHTQKDKAFRSVFITRLLATTHLHNIKGHVDVPALDTDALVTSGAKGIIGLCGAALERALRLIHRGEIEVNLASASSLKGKLAIRTPVRLNKASGKESTAACSFSEQNWGTVTRKLTTAVGRRTPEQIADIIELSGVAWLDEADSEAVDDSMDEYSMILLQLEATVPIITIRCESLAIYPSPPVIYFPFYFRCMLSHCRTSTLTATGLWYYFP